MQSDGAIVDLDRGTGARNHLQKPPFSCSAGKFRTKCSTGEYLELGSHAARNRPNASAGPVFPRTGRSHPLCGPPIPGSSEDQKWPRLTTKNTTQQTNGLTATHRKKIKKFFRGRSACVAAGRWCRARTRLQWLLQDDLAGVEVPAGIHGGEQPIDHVHARRRDVLLQPGGMLSADCVVVRQRAA